MKLQYNKSIPIWTWKKEIINLWTDGGRIIGIYLASKSLHVVDVEYDHLQEQIKKIVSRVM